MKKKRMRVAQYGGKSGVYTPEQWVKTPYYEWRMVAPVNRLFGVTHSAVTDAWNVIHLPTRWGAAYGLASQTAAVKLARALTKLYPRRRWQFTDPFAAKQMKKCKPLILKHGGEV